MTNTRRGRIDKRREINTRYPIDQAEIDDLRTRFPNNGSRKSMRFRDVIINRLLDECERMLLVIKSKEVG